MQRLFILLLLLVSTVPAFATGHCGNDPTKPDPVPFKCNGVDQLPLSSRTPITLNLMLAVEPPPPVLVAVEVEKSRILAGSPTYGIVTIDHAVKYDVPV